MLSAVLVEGYKPKSARAARPALLPTYHDVYCLPVTSGLVDLGAIYGVFDLYTLAQRALGKRLSGVQIQHDDDLGELEKAGKLWETRNLPSTSATPTRQHPDGHIFYFSLTRKLPDL
jgi:hypothetical protein